jgi:hypothetical protein
MEKYPNNYKGIVIQNNDSNTIGRVKVFVPEVNMTLYKGWNDDKDNDKLFTRLGENLQEKSEDKGLSQEVLERLKKCLPWAQIKQPIFGMSAPVQYDANKHVSTISNDSDMSYQHDVINKKNIKQGEKKYTQEGNKTIEALKQVAKKEDPANSPNSSTGLSNSPNSSTGLSNSVNSSIRLLNSIVSSWGGGGNADNCTVKSLFCGQTNNNVPSETDIENNDAPSTPASSNINTIPLDNIIGVDISFLPDQSYYNNINPNRSFTSSTITPQPKELPTIKTNINDSSTTVVADFVAPIKYQLILFDDVSDTNTNIDSNYCSFYNKPIFNKDNKIIPSSNIPVQFIPSDDYHKSLIQQNRNFFESANKIKFDGKNITVNKTIISSDRISEIKIKYTASTIPVNLQSERLGQLANLMGAYTQANSSLGQAPIIPPASIPYIEENEFGEFGQYNRGGGGGEIFGTLFSELLPIQNIVDSQIGGANPQSMASANYKKPYEKNMDPKKTKEPNLQSKADAKPAIRASTQNNKFKGLVSIPAVGAHVSVYFENGNPMYPIIDGCFTSQEDIKGVYDVIDT